MGQAAAKEVAHGPQYKTNVMFLCNHNSCRSQMADGWLRQLRGDAEVGVASAGIVGGTAVKPGAVEVMREAGVEIWEIAPDDVTAARPRLLLGFVAALMHTHPALDGAAPSP